MILGCSRTTKGSGAMRPAGSRESGSLMSGSVEKAQPATAQKTISNRTYSKPSDAELRKRLSPLEYEVTQHAETGRLSQQILGQPPGWPLRRRSERRAFSARSTSSTPAPAGRASRLARRTRSRDDFEPMSASVRSASKYARGASSPRPRFRRRTAAERCRYCINSACCDSFRSIVSKRAKTLTGAVRAGQCRPPRRISCGDRQFLRGQHPASNQGASTLDFDAAGLLLGWKNPPQDSGVIKPRSATRAAPRWRPTEDVHTGKTGHAEAVRIVFDRINLLRICSKWFSGCDPRPRTANETMSAPNVARRSSWPHRATPSRRGEEASRRQRPLARSFRPDRRGRPLRARRTTTKSTCRRIRGYTCLLAPD